MRANYRKSAGWLRSISLIGLAGKLEGENSLSNRAQALVKLGDLNSLRALARLSAYEKEIEVNSQKVRSMPWKNDSLMHQLQRFPKNWRVTRIQLNWLEIFFAGFIRNRTDPHGPGSCDYLWSDGGYQHGTW